MRVGTSVVPHPQERLAALEADLQHAQAARDEWVRDALQRSQQAATQQMLLRQGYLPPPPPPPPTPPPLSPTHTPRRSPTQRTPLYDGTPSLSQRLMLTSSARCRYDEAESHLRALIPALERAESQIGFEEPHRVAGLRAREDHWRLCLAEGGLARWRTRLLCMCWCRWRGAMDLRRAVARERQGDKMVKQHGRQVEAQLALSERLREQVERESMAELDALRARLTAVEQEREAARSQAATRGKAERAASEEAVVLRAVKDGCQQQLDEALAQCAEQQKMITLLETRLAQSQAAEAAWFEERRILHAEKARRLI